MLVDKGKRTWATDQSSLEGADLARRQGWRAGTRRRYCNQSLVLALDLVVAGDHLGIARWRAVAAALAAIAIVGRACCGRRGLCGGGRRCSGRCGGSGSAVVHVVLWLGRGSGGSAGRGDVAAVVAAVVGVHDDVGDAAAALGILGDRLVVELGLGVLGDDVPSMEETGDLGTVRTTNKDESAGRERARQRERGEETYKAQDAEQNVDDGVSGANAALDPDWRGMLAIKRTGRGIEGAGAGDDPLSRIWLS